MTKSFVLFPTLMGAVVKGAFNSLEFKHNDNISDSVPNPTNSNPFSIQSVLEQPNPISFMKSIYQYLLNWMKYHDPNRLPISSNTDGVTFSLSNYDFFFTSFNLIVYLMFTVLVYFIIIGFVLFSVTYFNKSVSHVDKVGQSLQKMKKILGVDITSAIGKMILILKVILVLVFMLAIAFSTYLSIYYHLPLDVAKDLNFSKISQLNKPTDYLIGYFSGGIPYHYIQKISGLVIICILGFYRTYILINPLQCNKFIKVVIVFAYVNIVNFVSQFILSLIETDNKGMTFMKLFSKCNISIDLVFYSFVIIIISIVAQYILFLSKEKAVSKCNWSYNSDKELFYNIMDISLKIVTSMAFFGLFQGALFVHSIPGDTYNIYSLLIFYSF